MEAESPIVAAGPSRRRLVYGVAAELARLVPSIATFLVLPRALGPARYGQLAALVAAIALVGSLATVGAHIVFVRDVTRRPSGARVAAGQAFTTTWLGGVAALLLTVPVAVAVFDRLSVATIVMLGVAELLFGNLLRVVWSLAVAREDQATLAVFAGVHALLRVGATVAYALSPLRGSLAGFALCYLGAAVAAYAAGIALARARGVWAGAPWVLPSRADVAQGTGVGATASVFYAQDGLDTPILVRAGHDAAAGAYASAYRLATLACAPVNALVLIGLPRLVRPDGGADDTTRTHVARFTFVGMAYGAAAWVVLWWCAPLLPLVLGRPFEGAVDVLRWLGALPLLRAAQYFVANLLMLNDRQASRLLVQLASAVVALVAYVTLIPSYSWRGAVAGTYLSELVLAAGLWVVYLRSIARARAEDGELAGALAA